MGYIPTEVTAVFINYRVILSVLDSGKGEYLKDHALHLEHIYEYIPCFLLPNFLRNSA
jgi:hypothetical protein